MRLQSPSLPCIAALLLLLSSCTFADRGPADSLANREPEQAALKERLESTLLSSTAGDSISLDMMVESEWDTVYLFGENSPGRLINEQLGLSLAEPDYRIPELEDVLVFTRNGSIVQYVVTENNLFAPLPSGFSLTREQATFTVIEAESNRFGKIYVLRQN